MNIRETRLCCECKYYKKPLSPVTIENPCGGSMLYTLGYAEGCKKGHAAISQREIRTGDCEDFIPIE